jgi:hypothetical protein
MKLSMTGQETYKKHTGDLIELIGWACLTEFMS